MKFIKVFVAALLLVFTGSVYADSVLITNLEYGDVVDADDFMIIGHGSGYAEGGELLINIEVCSVATATCEDVYLDCEGMVSFGDVTIVNPVGKRICPVRRGKIAIVGKSSDNFAGDELYIGLKIWNPAVEEWQTDSVVVYTE